jgi:hypothetical protein
MQREFAIGKYDTAYGDGWRRLRAADWRDPAFQAALVQAHREGGGWPLLEEPLTCMNVLWVAEGPVQIDGAEVVQVGSFFSSYQLVRGVYPAMNRSTKVAWTTTAPALGKNWTVEARNANWNPPCLFVQVHSLPLPLKSVYERQTVAVWAAYPSRPASSRLTDLFEMPQSATQLLAGCRRGADSSAFALLVRRDVQYAATCATRRYQQSDGVFCTLHYASIQIPSPDQDRFFDSADVSVASTEARWMRTLQEHPLAEVHPRLRVCKQDELIKQNPPPKQYKITI